MVTVTRRLSIFTVVIFSGILVLSGCATKKYVRQQVQTVQPQIQEVFEIIKSLPGVAIFRDLAEFDRYLAVRQKSYEENQSSR